MKPAVKAKGRVEEAKSMPKSIRFSAKQWETMEKAAEQFRRIHGLKLKTAELVRAGAIRYATEILNSQAA